MKSPLTTLLVLSVLLGCTTSEPPEPTPAPAPVAQTEPPPPEIEPAQPATEPTAEPASVGDKEIAMELVEEGRTIQQQRGEGGARDAIDVYNRALEQDPECGAALWELGWSHQVLEELDEALAAWDKLRALQPDYPELDTYYPVLVMRRDNAATMAALPDPGALPPPEETPRKGPTITLNAVGDVHMGRAWPESRAKLPPNDGRPLFARTISILGDADITFGNLETVLKDDGPSYKCGPKSTKCFSFRVPTSFAHALKEAGFDVMSIANNHAGDFGPDGRETTMKVLDEIGILHSGPIGDLASWETKGLRIGLVAFSTGAGTYLVQKIDVARKVVAELDRNHDLVIVSFHGGAEGAAAAHITRKTEKFYGENRGNVWEFAHAMVDSGADLILGHGPHRLRAMEIYRGRLIAYSLGNFSTWRTFSLAGALGISTVLKVELAPNGVALRAEMVPVIIEGNGIPAPDPKERAIRIVRDLSREDFGEPLFDAKGKWQRPVEMAAP